MKIGSINIKSRSEYFFILFFSLFWVRRPSLDLLKGVLINLGLGSAADATVAIVWIIFAIPAVSYIIKWMRPIDYLLYFIIIVIYEINFYLYPNNIETLELFHFSFLCCTFPFFFVGLALPAEKIIDLLYKLSKFVIVLIFLYQFIYGRGLTSHGYESTENITAAYALLVNALIVAYYALEKRKIIDIFFVLLSLFMFLAFNNRGSILSFVLFVVAYCLIKYKLNLKIIIGLVILGIIIVINFDWIFSSVYHFFESFGLSTRIADKIADNQFFVSEGRDDIFGVLIAAIDNSPFFGYGIGGDRFISQAIYAHNIFLEFLISFGIVIGTILSLGICVLFIWGYIVCHDKTGRVFILMLICGFFLPLLVSSTYLADQSLFLLIGFCVRQIRRNAYFRRNTYISKAKSLCIS